MFGQQGGMFRPETSQPLGGFGSILGTAPQQQSTFGAQPQGGGLFGAPQQTGLFGQQQAQPSTFGGTGGSTFGGIGGGGLGGGGLGGGGLGGGLGLSQGVSMGNIQQPQGGGGLFGQPSATYGAQGGLGMGTGLGGGMGGLGGGGMGGLGGGLGGGGLGLGMQQGNNQQLGQQGGGGLFGQQQQQAPTFGQPQQQQGFGQQSGSLFGTVTTTPPQGGFFQGQGQGQTGLFGQPQQQPQQQGGFGGLGMFGSQPPQQQGLGFGQQGQQQQIGAFGSTPMGGGMASQIVTPGGQDDSTNDIQLEAKSRVEDTISTIVWAQQAQNILATAGWDGKVKIYEIIMKQGGQGRELTERRSFQVDGGFGTTPNPILCMDAKTDFSQLYCGCAFDNSVKLIDVNSGQVMSIGQHNMSVMAVFYIESIQMVLSISYDQTLKVHDPRQPGQPKFQTQFNLKPLVADFNFPLLVIGFATEKISIINVNELQQLKIQYLESPLGQYSQLTSLQIFKNKDGFGLGSIDGRGHLSNIITKQMSGMPAEYQLKNIMTFKAHKLEDNQRGKMTNYFFPVNTIQFNIRNNQFLMTGGGEGQMIFWDIQVRNKIKTFSFNNNPVVCSRTSQDGTLLAYALGNDFSKGTEFFDQFPNKLCVHMIYDNELKCAAR